jgi:hypothetical protein
LTSIEDRVTVTLISVSQTGHGVAELVAVRLAHRHRHRVATGRVSLKGELAVAFLITSSVSHVGWRVVDYFPLIVCQISDAKHVVVTTDLGTVASAFSGAHVSGNIETRSGSKGWSAIARGVSNRRVS